MIDWGFIDDTAETRTSFEEQIAMPEFVLPEEGDRCPECDLVLYRGKDCECGKCPAPKPEPYPEEEK